MADEIDIANDRAQQDLDAALARARCHEPPLTPTGRCYNCNEPVLAVALFCDSYCRDDYEHRLSRHAK